MRYLVKFINLMTTAIFFSIPTVNGLILGEKLAIPSAFAQDVSYNRANSQSKIDRLLEEGARYYQDWEYQKALEKFQQVLKVRREMGDLEGEARALFYLGVTYNKLGEGEKVFDSYWEVMGVAEEASSKEKFETISKYLCRSEGGQKFLTAEEKINPIKYCEGIQKIEGDSGSVTILFDEDKKK
ncbi:MAG: hypothetical protein AB4080_19880 [Trichodesmium sp.]